MHTIVITSANKSSQILPGKFLKGFTDTEFTLPEIREQRSFCWTKRRSPWAQPSSKSLTIAPATRIMKVQESLGMYEERFCRDSQLAFLLRLIGILENCGRKTCRFSKAGMASASANSPAFASPVTKPVLNKPNLSRAMMSGSAQNTPKGN